MRTPPRPLQPGFFLSQHLEAAKPCFSNSFFYAGTKIWQFSLSAPHGTPRHTTF